MPIVNVANHFIETNGNPVDPDKIERQSSKSNHVKQDKKTKK